MLINEIEQLLIEDLVREQQLEDYRELKRKKRLEGYY